MAIGPTLCLNRTQFRRIRQNSDPLPLGSNASGFQTHTILSEWSARAEMANPVHATIPYIHKAHQHLLIACLWKSKAKSETTFHPPCRATILQFSCGPTWRSIRPDRLATNPWAGRLPWTWKHLPATLDIYQGGEPVSERKTVVVGVRLDSWLVAETESHRYLEGSSVYSKACRTNSRPSLISAYL